LVERVVVDDRTPCLTLGLTLLVGPALVAPNEEDPIALRVARDAEGRDLVLTAEERVSAERAARALESAARQHAEERAARAEARIAELEQRAPPPAKART
ncbi:MAG TPA: hypothetical protein VLT33_26525, partial [Labilithrix sp.]|nr:hypothetical protein [Labilithrix sp.]